MEFKLFVKLIVPEIEKTYEVYIPINRTVKEVCSLINKMINEDTFGVYPIKEDSILCNRYGSEFYAGNAYIRDTSIVNGSQLVFF